MTAQPQSNTANPGRVFTIVGLVFGLLAIVFIPILFGPAGIVLGFVGYSKGDRPFGLIVGIGSIITMIGGLILGAVVWNSMH
jgi:hypothetical protein